MTIQSLAQATAASQATATTPSNTLQGTSSEFLKLFMAQLQNQNPLDPKNGADMVSQLAQFSSVEQATQTNAQLASLVAGQSSDASAGMASLVGRNCEASAGDFSIDGTGTPPPLDLSSTTSMKGSTVQITDANGKVIRNINLPDSSSATVQWDGKDDAGHKVPAGNYHISVQGSSSSTISAQWHGRIDAVELTPDGPRLRMGGVLVSPSDIRTIGASSSLPQGTLV